MIFVDCNGNKTLQSWFEFFIPTDHIDNKSDSSKKIIEVSWKKSLDYYMYVKSF